MHASISIKYYARLSCLKFLLYKEIEGKNIECTRQFSMNLEKYQRNLIKPTNYGTYGLLIFETAQGKTIKNNTNGL
jgi:hypothetical protein